MNIAIYQGFPFHYEMIGFAVEFCKVKGYHYHVYAAQNEQWSTSYEETFYPTSSFNHEQYDFVILLTDDDFTIVDDASDWKLEKLVSIDHYFQQRRKHVLSRVGIRPFPARQDVSWALPVWCAVSSLPKKLALIDPSPSINIACVGCNAIPTLAQLTNLFAHDDWETKYTFHMVSRFQMDANLKAHANIRICQNIETSDLFSILRKADYVLCIPSKIDYEEHAMSGVLPMAFSFGCRLILPQSWNKHYCFTSAIVLGSALALEKPTNDELVAVFKERDVLINARDLNLSNALNVC